MRSQLVQQTHKFRRERGELRLRHRSSRVNHDVPSCGYLLLVAAYDLAQPSPNAVAYHRASQCLFDAETEAASRQLVASNKGGEVGTRQALAGAVNRVEIAASHQARFARKPLALRRALPTTRE